MPAVAYLRRSRVDTRKPGNLSHEQQIDAVRQLAARHGDDPSALVVIEDWGRSGRISKQGQRAGFEQLLDMVGRGDVTSVYSYSLSRLGRSIETLAILIERCGEQKVPIRCADGFSPDVSTSTGAMVATIIGSVHRWQAEWTRERAAEGVAIRRKRGDHMGPAPFGFRVRGGELVDNPREQIDQVIDAFRRAGTYQGTARLLTSEGVKPRRGHQWAASAVRDMLRRRAPEILPRTMSRGRRPAQAFRFAGLLRCPCGGTLTGRHYRETHVSYDCRRSREDPEHSRPTSISETRIMGWLEGEAARLRVPTTTVEMTGDEARRDDLEARRHRVLDNYEDGHIDRAARDAKLGAIDEELEQLSVQSMVAAVPATIDWTWPPGQLNGVLTAMWEYVELDVELRPVRAEWRVPEWRSSEHAPGGR